MDRVMLVEDKYLPIHNREQTLSVATTFPVWETDSTINNHVVEQGTFFWIWKRSKPFLAAFYSVITILHYFLNHCYNRSGKADPEEMCAIDNKLCSNTVRSTVLDLPWWFNKAEIEKKYLDLRRIEVVLPGVVGVVLAAIVW